MAIRPLTVREARELAEYARNKMRQVMDFCAIDDLTWWSASYELPEKKEESMKKLYKVFVVNNEGEVFEKNVVSDSDQNAWYDVVREVAPDDKLEDLTVNVLTICPVKDKKCCC